MAFFSVILFEFATNNCIILLVVFSSYWDWGQGTTNPYFHSISSFSNVLFLITSKVLKANCNSFDMLIKKLFHWLVIITNQHCLIEIMTVFHQFFSINYTPACNVIEIRDFQYRYSFLLMINFHNFDLDIS